MPQELLLNRAVEIATVLAGNSPIAVQAAVRTLRHTKVRSSHSHSHRAPLRRTVHV